MVYVIHRICISHICIELQNFFRISKGSLGIGELSVGSLRFQDDDDDEPEGFPGLLAQQHLLALLPRIQLEVHDIAGDKQHETIDFLMSNVKTLNVSSHRKFLCFIKSSISPELPTEKVFEQHHGLVPVFGHHHQVKGVLHLINLNSVRIIVMMVTIFSTILITIVITIIITIIIVTI